MSHYQFSIINLLGKGGIAMRKMPWAALFGALALLWACKDTFHDEPAPIAGTVAEQLAYIQANGESGGEYTVTVNGGVSLEPQSLSYGGKTIAITLKSGGSPGISLNGSGALFTLGAGVTLILENLVVLEGREDNTASLVMVQPGGAFIMNGGTVRGNTTADSGGGVYVSGGSFTLNGGEIRGNSARYSGGGVFVQNGSFAMAGGQIDGNTAPYGGGAALINSGSFIMRGGTISGNHAEGTVGGNKAGAGGGVYISPDTDAVFKKTGDSVIYGDMDTAYTPGSERNTAATGLGHAVYWERDSGSKQRNGTLGAGEDISISDLAANWD
jgi:hypothetical protein